MEAKAPHYVFDQRWQEERQRLEGIEALWDAGSAAALERAGVAAGWSCVEVGAGGGSMVEWLAERVGPDGHVLATDVDTRFLEAIERDNVTVAESDILSDDLPGAPFDLVYSRLVVEHLGHSGPRAAAGCGQARRHSAARGLRLQRFGLPSGGRELRARHRSGA